MIIIIGRKGKIIVKISSGQTKIKMILENTNHILKKDRITTKDLMKMTTTILAITEMKTIGQILS